MEVKNIVLHQIKKEINGKPVIKCSNKLLDANDVTIIAFVKDLIKNYASKNPTQGTFEKDEDNYPFQKKVRNYLDNEDFLAFSIESMNILNRAIDIGTTTGGYVVFVHYFENKDFLISAMLDSSEKFSVDDNDLGLAKLKTLDIDKLSRANRLNVTKWLDNENSYLSFIRGTKDVSKFFLKFIGSTDATTSKDNFKKLKEVIDGYLNFKNFPRERKYKIRDSITNYILNCYNDKKEVLIDTVSSVIDSESPRDLMDYLETSNIEVSGNISIHGKTDFENFYRKKVKEDGYTLFFEEALIKSHKIIRQGNNIVITDVAIEILDKVFEKENES